MLYFEGKRVGSGLSAAESVYRGTQAGPFLKKKGRDVDTHGGRVEGGDDSTACTTGGGGGKQGSVW